MYVHSFLSCKMNCDYTFHKISLAYYNLYSLYLTRLFHLCVCVFLYHHHHHKLTFQFHLFFFICKTQSFILYIYICSNHLISFANSMNHTKYQSKVSDECKFNWIQKRRAELCQIMLHIVLLSLCVCIWVYWYMYVHRIIYTNRFCVQKLCSVKR